MTYSGLFNKPTLVAPLGKTRSTVIIGEKHMTNVMKKRIVDVHNFEGSFSYDGNMVWSGKISAFVEPNAPYHLNDTSFEEGETALCKEMLDVTGGYEPYDVDVELKTITRRKYNSDDELVSSKLIWSEQLLFEEWNSTRSSGVC